MDDREGAGTAIARPDLHVRVIGLVQGVGFRDSMIGVAHDLGVTGWVRNCRDGSVEAVVRGSDGQRAAMLEWLQRGPPAARVEHLAQRDASAQEAQLVAQSFRRLPSG